MKRKSLTINAMLCAAFMVAASCSNDDVIQVASDSSPELINYSVNVPAATGRASDVYNSSTLPEYFYLWSTFTPTSSGKTQVFFNSDVVKNSNATEKQRQGYGGTQYWPVEAGKLNFYAIGGITPDTTKWAWNTGYEPTYKYSNTAGNEDLLYAVTKDRERSANPVNDYVAINFRHALAQIAFKVEVNSPSMYVHIDSIEVRNISRDGTFKFPTTATSAQLTSPAKDASPANSGTWTISSTDKHIKYSTCVNKGITCYDTSSGATGKLGAVAAGEALMLLPSTYTAWTGGTAVDTTSVYFAIKCKIYNSLDGKSANVLLWDNVNSDNKAQYIYVPATFTWKQGCKYTYTFVFGTGTTGGYDSNTPTQQVLFPLKYKWTCDDWVEQDSQNVSMTTKISGS